MGSEMCIRDRSNSIIFCSGKFVYDIQKLIQDSKVENTGLITVEELFPFPEQEINDLLTHCKKDAKIYWVQEENLNGGAFSFVYPRFVRIMRKLGFENEILYVGRKAVSTTAVGNPTLHKKEAEQLNGWIK